MYKRQYLDGVLIDKRLPRWNLFYLNNLKKTLSKYDFSKVFDLQNSSRTKFYKRFIIKNVEWSSTETALEPGQRKSDFDKDPVLDRMEIQLKKSGIETEFTKNIDLSWAVENTSYLVKKYTNREYILLFPFCSPKLKNKKWPYYKELIQKLKQEFKNKYSISNVGKVVTSTFLVRIHDVSISTIASLTCFESFDSKASINIFSSRTKNGRYLIFLLFDGNTNS